MSEWVKAESDLPSNGSIVLVFGTNIKDWDGKPIIRFGRFVHVLGEWRLDGSNSNWNGSVTHWMPLPDPPKEGE